MAGLADISYVSDNEWLAGFWVDTYNPKDRMTIASHGSEDNFGPFTSKNIRDIIKELEKNPKYNNNPNIDIEIQTCYAEKSEIPQKLADATSRNVIAYEGYYWPEITFIPKNNK
jgi:uncharacterized protein YpiB (UPF0302 family)